jgi:hypothetical protein
MKSLLSRVAILGSCALILACLSGAALAGEHRYNAPELDPNLMKSGLALLAGTVLVLSDRRRRDDRR